MGKLIDLNARRDQEVRQIMLADASFNIRRVVIAARVMYGNYLATIADLMKDVEKMNRGELDARDLEARYKDVAGDTPDLLLSIIEVILRGNGLEFDRAWWEASCDVQDMRNFIDACMSSSTADKNDKKKEG